LVKPVLSPEPFDLAQDRLVEGSKEGLRSVRGDFVRDYANLAWFDLVLLSKRQELLITVKIFLLVPKIVDTATRHG
jgi:hypothetical protein